MQIEFRNLESQSDFSNIPGHVTGDVEYQISSNRATSTASASR